MKLYSLFLFALVGTFKLNAQTNPSNDLDNIYTPDKNSILNSESTSENEGFDFDIKYTIKFNPTLLVRGIAPFSFEYFIGEAISLQAALGPVFQKDNIQLTASEEISFTDVTSSLEFSELNDRFKYSPGPTLYSSLGIRFYFDSYYYENRSYLELGVRYHSLSLKYTDLGQDEYYDEIEGSPTTKIKNLGYSIMYGYQLYTEGKIKTAHDFYFGFGLKNISYDAFRYDQVYKLDQWGYYDYIDVHTKAGYRESILVPGIFLGYAFGFAR